MSTPPRQPAALSKLRRSLVNGLERGNPLRPTDSLTNVAAAGPRQISARGCLTLHITGRANGIESTHEKLASRAPVHVVVRPALVVGNTILNQTKAVDHLPSRSLTDALPVAELPSMSSRLLLQ
jgi:hypothetical protein